jgi:twitching motility two-component system response regulator PilH
MKAQILVVEDSQVERLRLAKLLEAAGYSVRTADNGLEAIAQVQHEAPALILMDVNMPQMDGFAATRALRGGEHTKTIPVVLVTAKDQKADKAWGQMLGAKGYITKPYSDDALLAQVRALLPSA